MADADAGSNELTALPGSVNAAQEPDSLSIGSAEAGVVDMSANEPATRSTGEPQALKP
jgi:hypothetical protein